MKKEDIVSKMINISNGLNYQNLDILNIEETAEKLQKYSFNKEEIFKTPYWNYVFKNENSLVNAVGKWWIKSSKPMYNIIKEGLNNNLLEYGKWPNKYGVVCFYVTEENIIPFAKFLKENYREIYDKNISFKYDIDTINNGKSKFKIQDKI